MSIERKPEMTELDTPELSIIIPAFNEGSNLARLLPWLNEVLDDLGIAYEVLIVTSQLDPATSEAASVSGAQVFEQTSRGYGGALLDGFRAAKGTFFLTMDADLSHSPTFVKDLWNARDDADVTIASRYVPGGAAQMPLTRLVLSRILNAVFRLGLSIPVHDLSSGFRLYRASALRLESFAGRDFDLLEEILVRTYCEGWQVQEIPFVYLPREDGASTARLGRVGRAYLRTFWPLWKLRNSIGAADYDDRAYDSRIPLQRFWQRRRQELVSDLFAGQGPVLDVGCGSSRIIATLPEGSVALDILARKVRYARKFSVPVVRGSGLGLPFPDDSFSCVLSSQVIEYVPKASPMIDELCRVLKPGGRLILGTPDYSRWEWRYLEKIYAKVTSGGYADEEIAHYTRHELLRMFDQRGFTHEATHYILRGELIISFRGP